MRDEIIVIGGGLAGTEAALQIAKRKIKVKLYEMKPVNFSPAHSNENLAEIVCSNSFKSNSITNACGLLKEELRRLGSFLIPIADKVAVPAGQALAVDREKFAAEVTKLVEENEYIEVIREEVEKIPDDAVVIIATGPLTSDKLSKEIIKLTGDDSLHFYDAAAPIVEKNSIDMNIAFSGDRYDQERALDEDEESWKERIKDKEGSYINLPMNKEEYENFWNELVNAEVVTQDRTNLENYGVKKKWKITEANKDNILRTPKVDASEKIYDFENVLTDTEKSTLKEEIDKYMERTGFELIIVIKNLPYSQQAL